MAVSARLRQLLEQRGFRVGPVKVDRVLSPSVTLEEAVDYMQAQVDAPLPDGAIMHRDSMLYVKANGEWHPQSDEAPY